MSAAIKRTDSERRRGRAAYDEERERAAVRFLRCLTGDACVLIYRQDDGRIYKAKVLVRGAAKYWNFEYEAGPRNPTFQAPEPRRPAHCAAVKLAELWRFDPVPNRNGLALLWGRAEELAL